MKCDPNHGDRAAGFRRLACMVLVVLVPWLIHAVAQDSLPGSKYCPTCKHHYPATQRFCSVDGVPLVDAPAKREGARSCPRCKAIYDSGAKFCSVDGAPLVEPSQLVAPKIKRSARNDAEYTVGTLERMPKRLGKSAQPGPAAGEPKSSIESEEDSAKFLGTLYISALREAMAGMSGERQGANSPEARNAAARADKLGERFRNKRRMVASIMVRSGPGSTDLQARAAQAEIARRIAMAGPRDLELVTPATLARSPGLKRILIDLTLARPDPADPRMRLELALRDIALVKAGESVGELPAELDAPQRAGELSGVLIGDLISQTGLFAGALDAMTMEIQRRLHQVVELHFDEGRRLAESGRPELALEEYLRYLFATPEFDSPQAGEANQYVVASLGFSVLDWLWGEPEVAVIESGSKSRRLPLGFRAAPGEASNGEMPRTIVCLRDGSEMIYVPGGTEQMGDDSGPVDSRPAHSVTLSAYYMDKLETSVGQYERFIAAIGHRVPQPDDASQVSQWDGRAAKKQEAAMPVVYVSWHDARAYALWAGKSLPSEAQWERAARGGFAPDYPRSVDSAFDRHVNAGKGLSGAAAAGTHSAAGRGAETLGNLASVYSFSAAPTPFGCQNMLGNVAEWCRDWYDPSYYSSAPGQDPLGPAAGDRRVVRGGSWHTPMDRLSPTARDAHPPTDRTPAIGFRCVLLLPGSAP